MMAEQHPGSKTSAGDFSAVLQSIAMTVAIAIFVITFVVQAFQIPSQSMEDTLLTGDYLLVDKVHFAKSGVWNWAMPYASIARGDIIVFRYPVRPAQHFVKRIIGLPGDRVRLVNKQVWVNGVPLQESYTVFRSPIPDPYRDDFPSVNTFSLEVEPGWRHELRQLVSQDELRVPPGEYFVMGDNRDQSLDSRYWGFVPRENVIGRPLVIYWSLREDGDTPAAGASASDRIFHFAYVVTHIHQLTRWNRTLRLVR